MSNIQNEIVIGIDTGASGAVSMFINSVAYKVFDMPAVKNKKNRNIVSGYGLKELLLEAIDWEDSTVFVVIEDVHSMPKQGLASTFDFGVAKGVIIGVVEALELRYELVSPQKWKKHCGLISTAKDFARTTAIRTYPHLQSQLKLKKHIDRADALLIGQWGCDRLRQRVNEDVK